MRPVGDPGWVDAYLAAHEAEAAWKRQFPHDELAGQDDGVLIMADSEFLDLSEISAFAGESFNDATPGECADRLERMRASGLNVPQYAIDALREEQRELEDEECSP